MRPFRLLPALLILLAASAQQAGLSIGWYNGEWHSGIPSLGNWYASPQQFVRAYDTFQVPEGGWTVVSVFSDNGFSQAKTIVHASWEIRRGMAPGNGGEIVASGVTPAIQTADPSVTKAKYPEAEVPRHFRIIVENLHVQLPAGRYWLSVTPVGTDKFYISATLGRNAVGIDANGPGMALMDAPDGPHFALAEAVGRTGQYGVAKHFAQGVVIAR